MEHICEVIVIGWLAFWLTSCTAPPIVGGDYRLPERDIREIKAVVIARSDIRKPILEITADRAITLGLRPEMVISGAIRSTSFTWRGVTDIGRLPPRSRRLRLL
jgi:hypothetical protein